MLINKVDICPTGTRVEITSIETWGNLNIYETG